MSEVGDTNLRVIGRLFEIAEVVTDHYKKFVRDLKARVVQLEHLLRSAPVLTNYTRDDGKLNSTVFAADYTRWLEEVHLALL